MNLKDIKDTAKTALDIANELKHVELKEAILDLKEKLIELREENIALKEQLKDKQKYNMQFSQEDNCYWNIKEDSTKEGPFCPKCYDTQNLRVRALGKKGHYRCPNCKTIIYTKEYDSYDHSIVL